MNRREDVFAAPQVDQTSSLSIANTALIRSSTRKRSCGGHEVIEPTCCYEATTPPRSDSSCPPPSDIRTRAN